MEKIMEFSELCHEGGGYSTADLYKIALFEWKELNHDTLLSRGLGEDQQAIFSCYSGQNTKAIRWVGDSMLPYFPDGTILIFDCARKYRMNDFVLIWDRYTKQALFRQLIRVAGDNTETEKTQYAFKAYQETIADIPQEHYHDIIGVLVATHMNFE